MIIKKKSKNKVSFFLVISLFLTSSLTLKTFKKVNLDDVKIEGSKIFSKNDILSNSSLKFPISLIFIKTKLTEKELKKNLSLKKVKVMRQIFPFGLKVFIKTRTPIAYGEIIDKGEKISGYIDEDGYFIDKKYADTKNLKQLSIKVSGWKENSKKVLTKIFDSQKYYQIRYRSITIAQNGFLTLEEESLKKIFLGLNPELIEMQLEMIVHIKNQLEGKEIFQYIKNIDLTDPTNPKIKVFKP